MKRFLHWPTFFLSLLVRAALAFAVHLVFRLNFWLALPIIVLALLVNGALAACEDERPAAFNNPKEKE